MIDNRINIFKRTYLPGLHWQKLQVQELSGFRCLLEFGLWESKKINVNTEISMLSELINIEAYDRRNFEEV